jgi:hypothetical protein
VRQRLERQRGRIADDNLDLADDHVHLSAVDADRPRLHAVTERLDFSTEELGKREPRDDVPHERHDRG